MVQKQSSDIFERTGRWLDDRPSSSRAVVIARYFGVYCTIELARWGWTVASGWFMQIVLGDRLNFLPSTADDKRDELGAVMAWLETQRVPEELRDQIEAFFQAPIADEEKLAVWQGPPPPAKPLPPDYRRTSRKERDATARRDDD